MGSPHRVQLCYDMIRLFVFSLVPIVWLSSLFCSPHASASVSAEEVKAAIDDISIYQWTLSVGDGASIEVVDDPSAKNGTALKVTATQHSND